MYTVLSSILLLATSVFGKAQVFVSIIPQIEFVKAVGGEHVEVQAFVGEGANPEMFQPTISHVKSLSKADLYFSIGVPFERAFLPKVKQSFKHVQVIDTQIGIDFLECDHAHHHGDHDHSHAHDVDPHTWLSPLLVKLQVNHIRDALIDFDPSNEQAYEERAARYLEKLDALHGELTATLSPYRGQTFYVYHPAFGYFAEAYGLKQEALEFEGKKPSPKYLHRFIKKAKAENIRALYTQPQFSSTSVSVIAKAINSEVLSLDPLAVNYIENMRSIALDIKRGFDGVIDIANQ